MGTPPEALPPSEEPRAGLAPAQIALAVGGVLLLLLLVWFFFLRGDAEEVETPAAPVEVTDEDETDEEPAEVDEGGGNKNGPVETFEVFAPKDPFDPLISASAGTGGDSTGGGTTLGDGSTTTTTGDGTGTTTTTDDGTGTTTTTTTTSGGGGGGQNVGGHRVRVIDVYQEGGTGRAQVQVDGTVYTVDEGERFAGSFRLMSTSGRCASMLYGDDQFTLCEGEEILK